MREVKHRTWGDRSDNGDLGHTVGMLFSIESVSLGLCCVLGTWEFFYFLFVFFTHGFNIFFNIMND